MLRSPRVYAALQGRTFATLGDTFDKKVRNHPQVLFCHWGTDKLLTCACVVQGKVEEDRHIRAIEEAQLEKIRSKKREEDTAAEIAEAEAKYIAEVVPVMTEIQSMLDETGESLSQKSLEKIALWKIEN